MRKILYILSVMCFSFDAVADGVNVDATSMLNFGKFVQVDGGTSTVRIDTNGDRTLTNAIASTSPDTHSGTVRPYDTTYSTGAVPETITFNNNHAEAFGFCSTVISGLTFSPAIVPADSNSTVNVGGTLSISGYCKEGIYKGDIDVTYQLTSGNDTVNKLVRIPFQFEVEEPLSVAKDGTYGDMDFGMYITPSDASTVTLSSSGVSTTGSIVRVGSKTPHCANIVATGVASRNVQMTFEAPSMYLYLNGDNQTANNPKLQVTNFTVNGGGLSQSGAYVFTLPGQTNAAATQNLAVGATLAVPANTAAGQYTGSIGVTFIYNDYIISNQ